MINIPHKKPIRFANEVLSLDDSCAMVSVSFFKPPTLAMICEAAAQSSGAFAKKQTLGYLLSIRDALLLAEPQSLHYNVDINLTASFDNLLEYSFRLLADGIVYAQGSIIIKVL